MPPSSDAIESLSRSQMLKIQSAFNGTLQPTTSSSSSSSSRSISPLKKKRRLNVIHDDEEEDEDEEEVVMKEVSGIGNSSGLGFGNFDPSSAGERGGYGGGGFTVDDEDEDVPMGGGFEIEPTGNGGGFIQDDQSEEIEEEEEEVIPLVEPRTRIPFKSIPTALEALNLPFNKQIMTLFKEAASDDEEGISSVSKDRFIQICAVLTGDSDGDDDSPAEGKNEREKENSDSSAGEEEEYVEEEPKGRKGATKRITRSNPGAIEVKALESGDDQVEDSGSDPEMAESIRIPAKKTPGKGTSSKGKKKSIRVVPAAECLDSFELFFEGSEQSGRLATRKIGYEEIRNAAKLLDEELEDEDIIAMLDLGRGGSVNLGDFSRILAEAL